MSSEDPQRGPSSKAGSESEDAPRRPQRKPSQIKAAARMLRKEARKIARKYAGRLGPELTASLEARSEELETLLERRDWGALERACEDLDDVLHEQASFARKGALRETVENVSVAVLVALGLRSCLYEPFKIPSPSMVPTLVPGDHIFVNKFRYGIQVPFTTTIVGEDMVSGIERGEVIVFRYPLDPSEDYIKRVIGLPGDTVRVEGDAVAVKRAGSDEFEYLKRERLDRPCPDNYDLSQTVEDCVLFEETLDDHTYVIRINRAAPSPTRGRTRTITVPEGGLLVMGDNRRDSADSLQWSVVRSAVFADGVITQTDLRDLTPHRVFETVRDGVHAGDPDRDAVDFIAERSSARHDVALELWRAPSLGLDAVFGAAAMGAEATTLAGLLEAEPSMTGPGARRRIRAVSGRVDGAAVRDEGDAHALVFRLEGAEVIGHLRCGKEVCPTRGELARMAAKVIEGLEVDASRPARELLSRPSGFKFIPRWSGNDGAAGRFNERSFRFGGKEASPSKEVRLRAWRAPGEGAALIETAARRALSIDGPVFELPHGEARLSRLDDRYAVVANVDDGALVFVLECGLERCTDENAARELAADLAPRAHAAAQDADKLDEVLDREVVGERWTLAPESARSPYEWDRVVLEARIRDASHALQVDVQHVPVAQLDAAMTKRRSEHAEAQDDAATGGFRATGPQGQLRVFAERETEALVELVCAPALCTTPELADALAKRAKEKLRDAGNFIDPDHRVEQPFVPRGNVKGRAERIWFPFGRFWRPID